MADWNYDAMESGYLDNQGRIQDTDDSTIDVLVKAFADGRIHDDLGVAIEKFRMADCYEKLMLQEYERAQASRKRAEDEVIRLEQLLADLEKENN